VDTAAPAQGKPRPKVERKPALPPAETVYHRIRKRFHLVFFLVFVVLPFSNFMRFDIPKQRFYFAGVELWISEFGIIFLATMFLMFLIAASAITHGRIYCSYACPQMIFSEWSVTVEKWAAERVRKLMPKWTPRRRKLVSGAIFYAVLGATSVFLAFVFTSYFVEPRDLLRRLLHFDLATVGGITGATVTAITFLDFTLVRQKFCTTVCPYGYLQGMLQDKNTLLVVYRDETSACIDCKKCVTVCEMGIDIRESPFQIECVHCGDCVDACEDVLRRIGHPGLIHYSWGEHAAPTGPEPWYSRWGFRDAKRVVILLVLLFYVSGLAVALSMRKSLLVRIAPDRTRLYSILPDGRIVNMVRLNLANRSSKPVAVRCWVEGLAGAELALERNPIPLGPGEVFERTFEMRVPRSSSTTDVNHVRIFTQAAGSAPEMVEMTFIMPLDGR
jgi:cytochrome c oxidase accessory protein FixG